MIKVLRIITRLNIGGPAIHTILLSSSLNKNDYKDVLICGKVSGSEGDMAYLAKDKKVEPIVIPQMGRDISPLKDIRSLLDLYSIIKREKPDIIHTHTAKAGTLGRLAAILAGVPIRVHTFHGHIFDGYFSPVKARVFLWIERILALFTSRIITVSDKVEYEIVDMLKVTDRKKSTVVPLGLELGNFLKCEHAAGAFRKTLGLGDDVFLVGIVGRLVPIKNHKMFIDASRMVLDRHPDRKIKFLIIGDGELKEPLKRYAAEKGIEDSCIFTGWVQDLAAVYADLDVVALCSLNEGTPVSLIEALAAARAVVATDVGGVRDLVADGDNGFLVRSGDTEAFSEKLSRLLEDGDIRSRFGKSGRVSVKERYSKERLVGDIEDLYRECLKKAQDR
ncbi:glycosyltransferase family 4 protein [Candidatus Omnitrophota bacterium]